MDNIDYLSDLPIDLFMKQITYLPYEEVIKVCQANKKLHNYCTNYDLHWKNLILNAFGTLPDYQAILREIHEKLGSKQYNYSVYTQFVNYLDPDTLLLIYDKQNDKVNFDRVFAKADNISKLIYYYKNGNFFAFVLGENMNKIAALWLIGLGKLLEFMKSLTDLDDKAYAKKFVRASYKTASQEDLNDLAISFAEEGNLKGLKRMIQLGADINAITIISLEEAKEYGHLDIIKYVWSLRGSTIEERGHIAMWSAREHPNVTKYIVELGIPQKDLDTLLRFYKDDPEMTEYLKSKGAIPSLPISPFVHTFDFQ